MHIVSFPGRLLLHRHLLLRGGTGGRGALEGPHLARVDVLEGAHVVHIPGKSGLPA